MAVNVTKGQIEATCRTLRKNLAEAIEWYGEDSYQVGRLRALLADSEQHLRDHDNRRRTA